MSSSRRRGRSPGASANPQPPTVTATQAGVADALLAETPIAEGQPVGEAREESRQETGPAPVTDETESQAVEAAAEQPASDVAAEDAVEARATEDTMAEADEPFVEAAPAEAQAAVEADEIAAEAEQAEARVGEATEAAAAATEAVVSETAEKTAEIIEAQAETLAQAAPAALDAFKPSEEAKPRTQSVRIGASFAFVPTLVPLTEINARLFAFARGEGEAALAHLQALTRAKSPAEAIRLQVTEMQRAADASLTCFSEIVRSANRLNDTARWH